MSLTDMWKKMREKPATEKQVPAEEALPRQHDSALLHAQGAPPPPDQPKRESSSYLREATPFANELQDVPESSVPWPFWEQVYPGHHKALVNDLARRGENICNWEIQDGRDLGVSDAGHTIAFTLHKIGTSATIQVELTLFKGQLSKVRVR